MFPVTSVRLAKLRPANSRHLPCSRWRVCSWDRQSSKSVRLRHRSVQGSGGSMFQVVDAAADERIAYWVGFQRHCLYVRRGRSGSFRPPDHRNIRSGKWRVEPCPRSCRQPFPRKVSSAHKVDINRSDSTAMHGYEVPAPITRSFCDSSCTGWSWAPLRPSAT